ncbi:MAG: histidinol phosphate phosphatase [Chitinivibrionales bacterium]|nr:histidinol phosphate phosphatase [Chitinivibrionales bacterium]MBD3359013.1 histidinol phosphate phosphatase [Chitinivibrionales bacterium]
MILKAELECARLAAQEAGRIQMAARGSLKNVERKTDQSPVTQVDRACEEKIRQILLDRFPRDGFLGEETGRRYGESGRTWIVDPLDGTRPFIRGIPTHSALVALEDSKGPAVGVACIPAMNETYWAARGGGAYCNDKPIHVSETTTLSQCMGSALGLVEKAGTPEAEGLLAAMRAWDYAYGFMDVYSYMCVADGRLDACVNLLDSAWDCAAAACIVTEAGGRFSDIAGNRTVHGGSFVISNAKTHDLVLNFFRD